MNLKNIVLAQEFNKTLIETIMSHFITDELNEDVTGDCKYKKTMKHPITGKVIDISGLDGFTCHHISKVKDAKELEGIYKDIENHKSILLTHSDCVKSVKDKWTAMNAAKTKAKSKNISDEVEDLIKEIAKAIKFFYSRLTPCGKTKVKTEEYFDKTLIEAEDLLMMLIINESLGNPVVNLIEKLSHSISEFVDKFQDLIDAKSIKPTKKDIEKLEIYIKTLIAIRKQSEPHHGHDWHTQAEEVEKAYHKLITQLRNQVK